jgi:hypothetical protein
MCLTCSPSTAGTSQAVLKESGPLRLKLALLLFFSLFLSYLFYKILSPFFQCFSVRPQRGFQAVSGIKSSRSDSVRNKEGGRYTGMAWPVE